VRTYLSTAPCGLPEKDEQGAQIGLRALITRIAAVSGNPRGACWRFVRQSGVTSKRSYRQWTKAEQQKLLDLIASRSPREVTMLLRRSPTSVRAMLHRLGAAHGSARIGSRNTPCALEPSFELTRGKRKFLPSIGIAMTVQSSSSNSVSVTCPPGAKCTMVG